LKYSGAILLLTLLCGVAYADGGHVRMQQTSGDLVITLFTDPEPLATGDADFSVMVQDRSTQQLLPDAHISLELHSPSGRVEIFHLSKSDATNKMLQAVTVSLPLAGDWSATLNVQNGPNQAVISTPFQVGQNHSRRHIALTLLILPFVIALLFCIHQYERRKQAVRRG
jgi:hypothetical protein